MTIVLILRRPELKTDKADRVLTVVQFFPELYELAP